MNEQNPNKTRNPRDFTHKEAPPLRRCHSVAVVAVVPTTVAVTTVEVKHV